MWVKVLVIHRLLKIGNQNTVLHGKQNIYFLAQLWAVRLGGRWELAFMVEDTAGVSTQFLSVALSVSFNRFSMNETTFCPKADIMAIFLHLSAIQIG